MDWLERLDKHLTTYIEAGQLPSPYQLIMLREMLREGVAQLEQPKSGIRGVKQVSIGGNCVQSVIVTGDGSNG